jgi:hypothetical protein
MQLAYLGSWTDTEEVDRFSEESLGHSSTDHTTCCHAADEWYRCINLHRDWEDSGIAILIDYLEHHISLPDRII